MKEVQLSQGYFALVDDEEFERVSKYKWCAKVAYKADKSIRTVYAYRSRPAQYLHQFILGVKGVDHKDHNGLNNQRYNLRPATIQQNNQNLYLSILNVSGYKGVHWDKERNKWTAMICVGRKHINLGRYVKLEEAARAYDAAALMYHKEFALTNAVMPL